MKVIKKILFVILILSLTAGAVSGAVPEITSLDTEASLAGEWRISLEDRHEYAGYNYNDKNWDSIGLPANLSRYILDRTEDINDIKWALWLRKNIFISKDLKKQSVGLILGRIGYADETYFNGVKIGATGQFPPNSVSRWNHPRYYLIPASLIRYGEKNVISVRISYFLFCQVHGKLALANFDEWRKDKNLHTFRRTTLGYMVIGIALPFFFIFFIFFIRKPESGEYLFFCLQLMFGFPLVLDICNFLPIFRNPFIELKLLGFCWAGTIFLHSMFIHRLFELKRKKTDIAIVSMLILILITTIIGDKEIADINLAIGVLILIALQGVYNFSVYFYAIYKRKPNAKMLAAFCFTIGFCCFHDGLVYLSRLLITDLNFLGYSFRNMTFLYGVPVFFTGISFVLVNRYINASEEIEELNTTLENFVVENEIMKNRLEDTRKSGASPTINSATEKKIEKIMKFVNDNYTSALSREGLAASIDVHPDNLGKIFRKYTKKKLSEYINELRINDAATKLRETDETVTDIAYDVGFESLRNFNRMFPRYMGSTPEKYRKLHRTVES